MLTFNKPPDEAMTEVVALMREMSRQTDPQELVRAYRERVRRLLPYDATFSISRRNLNSPYYRVTRDSRWTEVINPWKEKDRLPLLSGGLLADLIYGEVPRIIDRLRVPDDDPAAAMLRGYGSLLAIPQYDAGEARNMVISLKTEPDAFDPSQAPTLVWLTNLFGRATHHLVLSDEVREAYDTVDRELRVVSELQRSLLPPSLPDVHGLSLAAHYQTSRHAGGDYYDFFQLPDGRLGTLVADVSGHGAPAAVLMAITHTIAHARHAPPHSPADLLAHLNENLSAAYQRVGTGFVTAFYGTIDPRTGAITYASAGHPPARIRRADSIDRLDAVGGFPLGIEPAQRFAEATTTLSPDDTLVLYTDGITEARNRDGRLFGFERLDHSIRAAEPSADGTLGSVLKSVDEFAAGRPADDDRTLVIARASAAPQR